MRAWVAAAALLGSTSAQAEQLLDAGEAQAGAIVVLTLGKGTGVARASAVEQAAAEVFTASTAISLKPGALYGIDAPAVAGCDPRVLLSCVVDKALRESSAPPQVILLVSLRAQSGSRQRASGYLLALGPARAIASRPRSPGADGTERERELYAAAVELEPVELASLEPAALRAYFEQVLRGLRARSADAALGAMASLSGSLSPLGSIEVVGAARGAALELDARPLGVVSDEPLRITGVRPGERELRVVEEREEIAPRLSVPAGARVRAALAVQGAPPPPPPALSRDVLRWTGVGGAVFGVALMAIGGAKYSSVRTVCLSPSEQPGACGSLGTPSLGFDGSQALSGDARRINPAGVGFLPLGIGILTAGASWTLGCQLFGEDHELPWPQLLVGVGLGALSYALSAAAL